jgi:hypothetical protein
MLIDLPLLTGAMLAMLAAATAIDFLRDRALGRAGLASNRYADRLLVNVLFFAMMPATIYGWLFPLVPFSGWRAGGLLALFLFALGVAPTLSAYRVQDPGGAPVTMGHLFWLLLKYIAVYGLLTFIYNP